MSTPQRSVGQLASAARVVTPRRGRQPSTTREEVLAKALEVVDRDGLAGLTMRDLAREMGLAVGTVYAAAGSKEQILQGLADAVFSDLPEVEVRDGAWREALIAFFREVHQRLRLHPAIAQLSVFEPLVGSNVVAGHDAVFNLMEAAGLDDGDATTLFAMLASYTLGYTLYQSSREARLFGRTRGQLMIHLSDEKFEEGLGQLVWGFRQSAPPRR